jgi:chromosome partitioning protein
MALRSFTQLLRVIDHVRQEENPRLRLLGVLATMVRLDQEPSLNVMSTVWSEIDGVLETVIPRADVFAEASELGLPVAFLSGRTPPEARRFDLLASELEAAMADLSDAEGGFDEKPQRELL